MSRRCTKADRMIEARRQLNEAERLRKGAQADRRDADNNPQTAVIFRKFAAEKETRAARLERVAEWMVGV